MDASAREIQETDISDTLESFIGGRGIATRLAHDWIPFDVDPIGRENSLFFTTGPMQVSNMSFTGRTNCTGVSPLTGGLLSSNAGGFIVLVGWKPTTLVVGGKPVGFFDFGQCLFPCPSRPQVSGWTGCQSASPEVGTE